LELDSECSWQHVRSSQDAGACGRQAECRHGARTWVTVKGIDMGDGLRVLFGAFCGHAVESSLFIGSASALYSGGGAWHPFGCSTLPSVWYQSKDWFQVVGSFSIARRPWAVGSFAASPPLARTDCQSLAQGDRPDT